MCRGTRIKKNFFECISTHSSPHIVDMKAENPAAMGLSNSLTLLKMKKRINRSLSANLL